MTLPLTLSPVEGEKTARQFEQWHVDPKSPEHSFFEDVNILRHDGLAVAVCVHNGDITAEEVVAHAHLVAAAPDLLEAMRGIEHFSDAVNFRSDTLSVALRQWIDAGREAIARAEGRDARKDGA